MTNSIAETELYTASTGKAGSQSEANDRQKAGTTFNDCKRYRYFSIMQFK